MSTFSFLGVEALMAKAMAAQVAALTESGEHLAGAAQAAETAVLTGTLKASITADDPIVHGREATLLVHTGGESSDYAAYIHEGHRADGSHIIGAYPGGLKYLEKPLIENRAAYVEAVARATRGEF